MNNQNSNNIGAAADALRAMEQRKDAAYLERNQVVAALAKCFPSGVGKTAIEGWSEDWHGCVYIDLPTGQASWHFHDSHAYLFAGLPPYTGVWDGHDTDEKYRRVAVLAVQTPADQSKTIHYPECWDTAAYPTLESALHEIHSPFNCSECGPTTPDRRALQDEGKHTSPCARHCEATAFGIEIRNLKAKLASALLENK